MSITKRPTAAAKTSVDPAAAERFISGAPDASQSGASTPVARTKTVRGKQVAINFALPPELLMQVDQIADSLSISRAAFIKQALTRAVMAEGVEASR